MSMTLVADAHGDPRNAAYLAIACDLAYLAAEEGREAFQSKLGLDAHLISVDNTQAYVGQSDTEIVVAFRGSESPDSIDGFKDWLLTNANNFLIVPEGRIGTDFASAGVGARFHRGFMTALDEIWEPLLATVDGAYQAKERRVWVTGHSLGGGIALLAAWRLQRQFVPIHEVVTFGAPMVGNDLAAQAFQTEFSGKIFRYVDALDIVPLLPTVSLVANAYTHCLAEQVLGSAQSAAPESSPAAAALKSFAGKSADGLLNLSLMDEVWSCVKDRISHHMMSNYQARIKEQSGGQV